MFQIFDCTQAAGFMFKTRRAWLALLVAHIATKFTGRFHDYVCEADIIHTGKRDV